MYNFDRNLVGNIVSIDVVLRNLPLNLKSVCGNG